jgi:hypothetical protein
MINEGGLFLKIISCYCPFKRRTVSGNPTVNYLSLDIEGAELQVEFFFIILQIIFIFAYIA